MAMHAVSRLCPKRSCSRQRHVKAIGSCFAWHPAVRTSDQRVNGIAQSRHSCLLMGMEDASGNVDIAHGALRCGHLNQRPAHSKKGGSWQVGGYGASCQR